MPIAILGLLALSFVSYNYMTVVIEKELSNSMLRSVGKSAESINRWLTTIMLEPETIASTPAAKRINEDFKSFDLQNINRHKILHEKYPDIFQDIYAANSKGEYHTVLQNGDDYTLHEGDISNRPYFRSIMAGGPTQITPPLKSRTTGIPTIFMVAPIRNDRNEPQGLVGAGISLQYIQQIAQELKEGATGYGFILAQDGTYIYHPKPHFVLQKKITELAAPSERTLGKLMISCKSGMFLFSQDKQRMVAFYKPIPITGWSVATVIPEVELFAPAIKMIKLLTVIAVTTSILIGLALFLAMKRLTKPLQILDARTQAIAAGNLDEIDLEVTTKDEIGSLSQSFNIMANNLRETLSGLKKSEDNYRSIFKNSIAGILQIPYQGQSLNANPAFATMVGYASAESFITAFTNIKDLFVDQDVHQNFLLLLFEAGSVHSQEVQFYRKDNEIIWVSLNARLIRDTQGIPLRTEVLVIDISDRKQIEQEREQLFGRLAQAKKLEAVGQLAGGVAHDFNNMLSVILGQTELALLKTKPSDPTRTAFTTIKNAAEHSANLTRQLLGFARKQDVAPQLIDLNHTIGDTMALLNRLITEDIELTSTLTKQVWPVFIDPDQVKQMLTNLCVNARDAIVDGGKITITTKNASFDEACCANYPEIRAGDYVCMAVSDNGIGMDERTKKHIFDPFFTTKKIAKGTGLGLATVYGIAKQNNAFINVYSELNEGTTFKIYIPRYQKSIPITRPPQIDENINFNKKTILLVEDEPSLLQVATTLLEELGCLVIATGSPAEAIQRASDQSTQIDLVLTDVVMPDMNGRELATRIQELRPEIKCLFMSGYTADIITTRGVLDSGINFIQKPFTTASLAKKLREVLDHA